MLCLSRKKNEWIDIGDDIEMVIVDIQGDKVKLGFRAKKDIRIHRREVSEAIKRSLAKGTNPHQAECDDAAEQLKELYGCGTLAEAQDKADHNQNMERIAQ